MKQLQSIIAQASSRITVLMVIYFTLTMIMLLATFSLSAISKIILSGILAFILEIKGILSFSSSNDKVVK